MTEKTKITIYDVAKEAGVSRQTVSRVLNNRPDVSVDTRKHVQEIMQNLHYQPSAVAQSLSRQKSTVLGVVTAGLKFVGPSRTLSGITSKSEELGYGLLLKELESFSANNVAPLLQWFQSHQVDGIIWAVAEIGDNRNWLLDILPEIDIPIIFLTMGNHERVNIVSIDNFLGGKMATEHLLSLGKKNIGHISGPLDWWEARQRKLGWLETLNRAGLDPSEQHCAQGNWSPASGEQAIIQLLESFPELDAVFVANDQMALSVLRVAACRGIRIPEQLAVIGFDNIPESAHFYPSLSTISQDLQLLGEQAVQSAVDMITNWKKNKPLITQSMVFEPTIIVRESSGKTES
jgi:DNA-binding LacI/PurR family transcriptional regulator